MKITLFTAAQVMACLMLLSTGVFAEKDVTAVFHLHARYKNVTCNQTLTADGDISSGSIIDFGTFSSDSVEKTKSVVLKLDCTNDTDLPDTVRVGFSVGNSATVDPDMTNRLYPSYQSKNVSTSQNNLYYDWVWGDAINSTVKQRDTTAGHATLNPGDKVNLSNVSGGDVYEVVSKGPRNNELKFTLKITRNVDPGNISELSAGDYMADVKVTISYD